MTTRGAKAAEAARVDRLMELAHELHTTFVATCDWGGHREPERAVAYRKSGSTWLAVCEAHTGGDPKKVRR